MSLVFKHKFACNLVLFNWGFQSSISVSSQSGISELLDNNRFALEKWKCKEKSGSHTPTPTYPAVDFQPLPEWRACSVLMETQWATLWKYFSAIQCLLQQTCLKIAENFIAKAWRNLVDLHISSPVKSNMLLDSNKIYVNKPWWSPIFLFWISLILYIEGFSLTCIQPEELKRQEQRCAALKEEI